VNVRDVFGKVRATCAAMTAAALVLAASPTRAFDPAGLGGYDGPIAKWLARAPASCVIDSYLTSGWRFPNSDHVAYWVGHAMDGDFTTLDKVLAWPGTWNGLADGVEGVRAVYDPLLHLAAYNIGHQDMDTWGVLADEPEPPIRVSQMRADLSKVSLGGNVHLGDSLAAVTSALGLHALTPTDIAPACPGFGVVELCDWNVARCTCPPSMFYEGSRDISGTIIFRNGRVVGFVWSAKCWAAG
jgi:hypothetical protein